MEILLHHLALKQESRKIKTKMFRERKWGLFLRNFIDTIIVCSVKLPNLKEMKRLQISPEVSSPVTSYLYDYNQRSRTKGFLETFLAYL